MLSMSYVSGRFPSFIFLFGHIPANKTMKRSKQRMETSSWRL